MARRTIRLPALATAMALTLCLGACKDKGKGGEQPAPEPPGSAVPRSPQIDCKRVLPPEIRDRWMAGMSEVRDQPCAGCATMCRFFKPDHLGILVTYECGRKVPDDEVVDTARVLRETNKAFSDAPGLGRGGVRSRDQVMFWDRDTDCVVTILWPNGQDELLRLAHAVEAALKPEAIAQ